MTKLEQAFEVLKNYKGMNNFIIYLQQQYNNNKLSISDFLVDYILDNRWYVPRDVEKLVNISREYGEKLQEKYNIEFRPEKIVIKRIIGETSEHIHGYIQFRKSVGPTLEFVNRRYILTPLATVDYNLMTIDFDKFDAKTKHLNRYIKEHQKQAVKFLLTNRKCILADTCGLGKTLSMIIAALEGEFNKVLVITTASLKSTWKREIQYYVPEEEITIINGRQWNTCPHFTIINYDILDNFYKLPEEIVYQNQVVVDNNGIPVNKSVPVLVKNSKGEQVPKKRISRKKDFIAQCLKESPLFLEQFDCVIIDECHKLSNNKSIRYKVASDFLKKANPRAVFMASGTPLTNNAMKLYHVLKLIDAEVTKDYNYYCRRYCGGRIMHLKDKDIMITNDSTNLDELRQKISHLYIRRLQKDIPGMVNKTISTRYYDLMPSQKARYDELWNEYMTQQEIMYGKDRDEMEDYRQLVEGSLIRQYLAIEMVENTIKLVNEKLEDDEKVIIICTYSNEIAKFKEYYGKKAVVYDGKMNVKQKDAAEKAFMENPKVKVFIGQIIACSVGLTLTVAKTLIFNTFSFTASDNLQAEDRIYRLTQDEDVNCIYQLFNDSVSQRMYEIIMTKERNALETIKSEKEKQELKMLR